MIIVGCSGLGSEVIWLARRNKRRIEGLLDDNYALHGTTLEGLKVLGGIVSAGQFADRDFLIAVANPIVRSQIVERLVKSGVTNFPILIDHQAIVGESSTIGPGSIIFPGAIVTVNSQIGSFTIINKNCSIGHDAIISDFCTLAPLAMTGGHVELEEGVDVGASSCVRQGLTIGSYSKIGMGSVVVRSVEANTVVVGNPAKPLIK